MVNNIRNSVKLVIAACSVLFLSFSTQAVLITQTFDLSNSGLVGGFTLGVQTDKADPASIGTGFLQFDETSLDVFSFHQFTPIIASSMGNQNGITLDGPAMLDPFADFAYLSLFEDSINASGSLDSNGFFDFSIDYYDSINDIAINITLDSIFELFVITTFGLQEVEMLLIQDSIELDKFIAASSVQINAPFTASLFMFGFILILLKRHCLK